MPEHVGETVAVEIPSVRKRGAAVSMMELAREFE